MGCAKTDRFEIASLRAGTVPAVAVAVAVAVTIAVAVAVAVAAALAVAAPAAHAAEPVLSESQAERGRIVEMLDPVVAPRSRSFGPVTRSIRPGAAPSGADDEPASRGIRVRPSASVTVTFETGSARLSDSAERALNEMAAAMKNERLSAHRFLIEGHADPRGPSELNLELSRARAEEVRRYLVEHGGVGAERLEVLGKGDTEPVNADDIAAPENRRVRFVRLSPAR